MKLNKEQQLAVNANDENIIVVAGAGSGKTRVLTERVKRLLAEGIKPHNIVCITFTNMAASEMKERLRDVEGIADTFIGTIHSFANKIYKESGISYKLKTKEVELGLFREVLPVSTSDLWSNFRYLNFGKYSEYMDARDQYESGLISEDRIKNFLSWAERGDLKEAEDMVDEICLKRNIISFDELLYQVKEYFNSIGGYLEHLLVDEYQDIGTNEHSFILGMNASHNFFVGDDWQAIYGFRGGNVNIFKKLFKTFSVYELTTNYRNSTNIIEFAESVIEQVPDRIEKETVAARDNAGNVYTMSKFKLDEVLDRIQSGKKYGDWFILTRSNKDLGMIYNMLQQRGIPSTTFKREGMNHQQINDLLAENSVKVLTVHVSKGLENKNVVLYGSFPQFEPHYRRNAEERRVMYVGCTRAEDLLIVLS